MGSFLLFSETYFNIGLFVFFFSLCVLVLGFVYFFKLASICACLFVCVCIQCHSVGPDSWLLLRAFLELHMAES